MSNKIRIVGGPTANNVHVFQVQDDGREVEIKGITGLKIFDIEPGVPITVAFLMNNVELDLTGEVWAYKLGDALSDGQTRSAVECQLGVEGRIDNVGE